MRAHKFQNHFSYVQNWHLTLDKKTTTSSHIDNTCQTCMKGKMTRMVIPKQSHTKMRKLREMIHNDLCGPMRTGSIQGNLYMVPSVDNETGWIHFGFLNKKSQQLKEFKAYQVAFKHRHRIKIRSLRTKGGGEYTSREVKEHLRE